MNQLAARQPLWSRFDGGLWALAMAVDALLSGDLSFLGDVLASGFKAGEMASREGKDIAENLKLIPATGQGFVLGPVFR